MRILMIGALLALAGCASAVYDSLDRRGVDAEAIFVQRINEARGEATKAEADFTSAADALTAIDGLDGAMLARNATSARAASQQAALAAQDLRLAINSVRAAGDRYFEERDRDLSLLGSDDAARRAAEAKNRAAGGAYRDYLSTHGAVQLRISPALSLLDAEAGALRDAPTSGLAAAARSDSRQRAIIAAREVSEGLNAANASTERLLAALN